MDLEGQEWLMPENAEPKPEKVNIPYVTAEFRTVPVAA
jgi:hypothetical protein